MEFVISVKQTIGWIVVAMLLGTIVPLLAFPITDWAQFFTDISPVMFLASNWAYYLQWIFWVLLFVITISAIRKVI